MDWVPTRYNVEAEDRDDYDQFKVRAWQEYAPHFAMDMSGEIRENVGPRTGKRKRYDSSVRK